MQSQEQVLSLIGLLYDATLDKNKWKSFLQKCCEVFNASSAQWAYVTEQSTKMPFTALYNLNAEDLAKFQSHMLKDPRTPDNLDKPWHPGLPDYSDQSHIDRFYSGHAINSLMFVTTAELHKSEIYQKVLKPNGIEYTCAITHQLDDDEFMFLGLMRNADLPDFTMEDLELIDQLSPHVKQVAIIHRNLCQLDFDRKAALETLNSLNMGLVLVDQYQQILFANKIGQSVLDDKDGFEGVEQRLENTDQSTNEQLKNSIQYVIQQTFDNKQTPGRAFSVNRPSGKPAYSVLVSPLWNNLVQVQADSLDYPIASVFIQDPDHTQNTCDGLLKEYYKLTNRETRVLSALLEGKNTKEISALMKVQDNTIRQHLKNIFVKTETNSQAELIQTIMASPLWLGAHEFSN